MSCTNKAGERESKSCSPTQEDIDTTQLQNQTLLEEVFTSDYNVTEEEVDEYCRLVGIDRIREPELLPLARAALLHPLPRPWTPVDDQQLGVYYFNQETGEGRWTHPVDSIVRSLLTRHRTTTSTDSCSEEFDTEEDQLISEFLRYQLSDREGSDGENSDHRTLSHQSHQDSNLIQKCEHPISHQEESKDPVNPCRLGKASSSDEDDAKESHKDASASVVPSDRDLKGIDNDDGEVKDGVTLERSDSSDTNVVNDDQTKVGKDSDGDVNVRDKESENEERQDRKAGETNPPSNSIVSAPDPPMLGGRDSSGRGLGRSPLGPPPLGTSSSLA